MMMLMISTMEVLRISNKHCFVQSAVVDKNDNSKVTCVLLLFLGKR